MQESLGAEMPVVMLQPQSLGIINGNTSPRNSYTQLNNLCTG